MYMYGRTCTPGPLPPYETAIGWRPYEPAPVLIGPNRIPRLCASTTKLDTLRTPPTTPPTHRCTRINPCETVGLHCWHACADARVAACNSSIWRHFQRQMVVFARETLGNRRMGYRQASNHQYAPYMMPSNPMRRFVGGGGEKKATNTQ